VNELGELVRKELIRTGIWVAVAVAVAAAVSIMWK